MSIYRGFQVVYVSRLFTGLIRIPGRYSLLTSFITSCGRQLSFYAFYDKLWSLVVSLRVL